MEKQSTRKFLKLIVALVAFFLIGAAALMLASCKEEHVHDFGEGVVTTNPTCTQTGVRTFTCSCGEVQYATEPVLGHDWNDPVTVDATCAKPGSITRTCARCNEVETTIIPATGAHTPSDTPDPKLSVAPTCASAGTNVYTCTVCGAVTATVTVPATGNHSWDEGVEYKASCESQGYTHYTCTVCGMTDDRDFTNKLDHYYYLEDGSLNYVNEIQATCTTAGSRQIACVRCGVRYADENYANAHPALGHKFDANTDADDTLTGILSAVFSNNEVGPYTSVAAAKLAGWTTVTAMDCTTGGVYERTCSRCGEYTETAASEATGHSMPEGAYVCKQNEAYIDANDNAGLENGYAYECENEWCSVEVIGKDGETHHWIPTVDHKYVVEHTIVANCQQEGLDTYTCSVCGDSYTEKVEKTDHEYNAVQMDGKTATQVCAVDALYQANDKSAFLAAADKAIYDHVVANYPAAEVNTVYTKIVEALRTNVNALTAGQNVSAFCLDCGTVRVAIDHEYVIGILKDNLTDYEVDDDGNPVIAEGVTLQTMTCKNIQVCKYCGQTGRTGTHPTSAIVEATCRNGAYCSLCNTQVGAQLPHDYEEVATILSWKDSTDATQKAIYDAYIKVSAEAGNSWMVPITASCTVKGVRAWVCVNCLVAAAEGKTVDWNHGTLTSDSDLPDADDEAAYTTNGYTLTATTLGHEYKIEYYAVNATSPDGKSTLVWSQLNCEFGYKVAYRCTVCNQVLTSNSSAELKDTDGNVIPSTNSTGWALKDSDIDLHKGAHAVYVPASYWTYNGYKAPTCIDTATLPVYCTQCGASDLLYTVDEIKAVLAASNTGDEFTCASANIPEGGIQLVDGVFGDSGALKVAGNVDANNHAGTPYACGKHCDAVGEDAEGNPVYCAGFGGTCNPANDLVASAHITVTITYKLTPSTDTSYFGDYTLQVATIDEADLIKESETVTGINWQTASFSTTDSASKCAGGDSGNYLVPSLYDSASLASYKAGDKFFVLWNGTDVYVLTSEDGVTLYSETGDQNEVTIGEEFPVEADDDFYLKIAQRPDIPVTVVDQTSFAYGIESARYDATEKAYVISFGEGAEVSYDTDADMDALATLLAAFTALGEKMDTESSNNAAIVLDLNGGSFTLSSKVRIDDSLMEGVDFTVKNGTLNLTGKNDAADLPTKYSIALVNSSDVVFDNVDIVTNKSGIYIDPVSFTGSLTLKNGSSIDADGYYGIYVNAPASTATVGADTKTLITIDGSTVSAAQTALFVYAPVKVAVTNSTLSAALQAAVVRAGDVTITDSTLNLVEGITDDKLTQDEYDELPGVDTLDITKNSFAEGAEATLSGYGAQLTLNAYRLAGIWGDDNAVARAALVVGNSTETENVKTVANVTLDGVTLSAAYSLPQLVVASHYNVATMYEGGTITNTVNVMVNLTLVETTVTPVYTTNTVAGSYKIG